MKESEQIVHELSQLTLWDEDALNLLIDRAQTLSLDFHFCQNVGCDRVCDQGSEACDECIQNEDDERRKERGAT